MKRADVINEITKSLCLLINEVHIKSGNNLNDVNLHSENTFMHLLNCMFDWNLRNLNETSQNKAGVDLMDDNRKIVVQVSAEKTVGKIQSSLEKIDVNTYNEYAFYFLSISGNISARTKRNKFILPSGITFDESHILDNTVLLRHISPMRMDKLEDINNLLKKEIMPKLAYPNKEFGITYIIEQLSKTPLVDSSIEFDIISFDIQKKIEINELQGPVRSVIEDNIANSQIVDRIYQEYDKEGCNKSYAVLNALHKEYLVCQEFYSGNCLYNEIAQRMLSRINVSQYSEEEIACYLDIVLVHAFFKCKIFKKP